MTDRKCPLGEDCDLTVAWMAGQQKARDSFRQRIEAMTLQRDLARVDADQQRARAEAAENRSRELSHKLDELDFLHHEGGPQSVAAMEEALRDLCDRADDVLAFLRSGAPGYLDGWNDAREAAAEKAKPKYPRPCDCEGCYCGNPGDNQAAAEWDAENALYRAILDITPPERPKP